jgi:membrane protein implicated in regulation of membrane protease activity
MTMKRWWVGKIAAGIGFFVVATLLLSLAVMLLWNELVPVLFNGPVISYAQSVGLLILSHILLRGWSPWRHRNGWRHDRWKKRCDEKLAAMTPEERERFHEAWRSRCGWDPREHGGPAKESAAPQA